MPSLTELIAAFSAWSLARRDVHIDVLLNPVARTRDFRQFITMDASRAAFSIAALMLKRECSVSGMLRRSTANAVRSQVAGRRHELAILL